LKTPFHSKPFTFALCHHFSIPAVEIFIQFLLKLLFFSESFSMTAFSLFGGLDILKTWLIAPVCTTTIIKYILCNIIKNT